MKFHKTNTTNFAFGCLLVLSCLVFCTLLITTSALAEETSSALCNSAGNYCNPDAACTTDDDCPGTSFCGAEEEGSSNKFCAVDCSSSDAPDNYCYCSDGDSGCSRGGITCTGEPHSSGSVEGQLQDCNHSEHGPISCIVTEDDEDLDGLCFGSQSYIALNPTWMKLNEGAFRVQARVIGCFSIGTDIKTPEGMKKVEDIKPGEFVYNPQTKKPTQVGDIVRGPEKNDFVEIFADGKALRVTDKHPMFTKSKGVIAANKLAVGDKLLLDTGSYATIDNIVASPAGDNEEVINFEFVEKSLEPKDNAISANGFVTGNLELQVEISK